MWNIKEALIAYTYSYPARVTRTVTPPTTNTKSLAKKFSEILLFEYFENLGIGFDVFFNADSESPRMT